MDSKAREEYAFQGRLRTLETGKMRKWDPRTLGPLHSDMGGFHKWGIPQNGWVILENPAKMDDLGYPHSRKPPYRITTRV